jgi:resuscitation-promoting factor RpfB
MNQTPPTPSGPKAAPRRSGFWSRLSPLQRVGVSAAALLLPCCGGLTAITLLAGDPKPSVSTTPAARNLAGDQVALSSPPGAVPSSPEDVSSPAEALSSPPENLSSPAEALSSPAGEPAAAAAPTEAAGGTSSPAPPHVVTKRVVKVRAAVPFATRKVQDDSLPEGETRVRVKGVAGVRTTTYEVTLTDGAETARRLTGTAVTKRPVTKVVAVGTRTKPSGGRCDPNYTPCVPIASDVDCAGGSGNGPAYVQGPVRVIGTDPYDLDRDGDGIACDK